jgi:hypothetical protein
VSVAAVVTVATHKALDGSTEAGASVAIRVAASYETLAPMAVPPGQFSLKLDVFTLPGAMSLLNVANRRVLVGTSTTGGFEALGDVLVTAGLFALMGAPRMGSRPPPPPPQDARRRVNTVANARIGDARKFGA